MPEGCENIDALPSRLLSKNFMDAVGMLQQPLERFLEETEPKPSCIISDRHHPWTFGVAQKFKIPRLAFDGTSCFTVTCSHFINLSKIHEKVSDDLEPFVVPSLPDMIELTKGQLPNDLNPRSVVLKVKEEDIVESWTALQHKTSSKLLSRPATVIELSLFCLVCKVEFWTE